MYYSNRQKSATQLGKLAGLILIGAILTACGGGGGSSSGEVQHEDHAKPIPVSDKTVFKRLGMDVQLPNDRGGWLDSTIDQSGNVTFLSEENDDYLKTPYKFTFATGLPGGALANGAINTNLYTTINKTENKKISILMPYKTKQVQNVFWEDTENPEIFGLSTVGFALKPNTITWPVSGTAIYKGKAFQYILDWNRDRPEIGAHALVTSDVTATVDFSANTIEIQIAPEAMQSITANSSVKDVQLNQFGATYKVKELKFTKRNLAYVDDSGGAFNGDGVTFNFVQNLDFFGENSEELAGLSRKIERPDSSVTPWRETDTYITFALVKQ